MPGERARLPRVPFGRSVSVTPEGDAEKVLQLQATNLSLGGMFVHAPSTLPRGTRVTLALTAAGRLLNFAEGEVAWVRPSTGFGVRFTQLRPRAQALVEHLVARGGTGESVVRRGRWRRNAIAGAAIVGVTALALVGALHRPKVAEVAPLVIAPAPVELTSARPPDPNPAARPYPGEFQVALPTGAASSLHINISDEEISVVPLLHKGATIRRVFKLPSPARLVIDVSGREPRYSWQLEGATVVKSVRVGSRNHGTRIVVDLPEPEPGHPMRRVVTPLGGV